MNFKAGTIKCLNCGKNFKKKKERNKIVLICSGYSNYGKDFCPRNQLELEDVMYTISKHLAIKGVSIKVEIEEYVKLIEVSKNGGYTVYYRDDGSKSIINDDSSPYGVKVSY